MDMHTHGHGARASTLWGKGPNGGSRGSTTWGRRGGSSVVAAVAAGLALLVPVSSAAAAGAGTYVAPGLLAKADKTPTKTLHVIVQSTGGGPVAESAAKGVGGTPQKRLDPLGGVGGDLPAGQIKTLATMSGLTVTSDALVQVSGSTYTSNQLWPYESGVASLWPATASSTAQGPAIAIVDSGVDTTRADFGTRVLTQVNLSSLTPNAKGDGRGHGTFVAGIAAGSAPGYAGAAPAAPIVSIRVMDDYGKALTSDVVNACSWILANKSKYNIRVANFSLHSATPGHFVNSPLDKAVEKLWFNGIFVTAAAGNFGVAGQPVRMGYAPGNDPFVMTVGAVDLGGTVGVGNDNAAPWSAFGYTYDGFLKPEIAAPGRYMVGPAPSTSTLVAEKLLNVTAPGYIQLSGTSFAAPVVAGAAQQILVRHPSWTPDQVKGALLSTAKKAPNATPNSLGAGELYAGKADAATWTDATWTDATWTDATWTDATWTDATWTDATWTDGALEDATWTDASEGDMSSSTAAYALDSSDKTAILADPYLVPPPGTLP